MPASDRKPKENGEEGALDDGEYGHYLQSDLKMVSIMLMQYINHNTHRCAAAEVSMWEQAVEIRLLSHFRMDEIRAHAHF